MCKRGGGVNRKGPSSVGQPSPIETRSTASVPRAGRRNYVVRRLLRYPGVGYPFETNAASFIRTGDLSGLRKPCFSYSYLGGD